jgi:two-component system cell cycle response regulator
MMRGQALKVLVVEDTFSNVKMLEAKLLNERFEVHIAFDGLEALSKLADHAFDIVLLDVMMPGMDGFEVCRRIKAGETSLPVIMITALDSPVDREAGFAAGADDYFVKPVADELLFARLLELTSEAAAAPLKTAAAG